MLRDVRSFERLADEVALFLHRPLSTMSADSRQMIDQLHNPTAVLAGKKVLVVDDDIRNIFAMTSVLEPLNMHVYSAETGARRSRRCSRIPTSTSCSWIS
ncbi:MAG: hypothetical protein QM702_03455 [Rubrivivax sp.]